MDIKKTQERIKEIEEEIRKLPYHKGTEHHIGLLKARLAKLRDETYNKSVGRGEAGGFAVKKEGDATVVMAGFPSVGKSTLLNALTEARSKVGFYPFTTLKVIPGMLEYKGAKIQIFDVPGLIEGASQGRGRGKEVISVIRAADLVLTIASAENPQSFETMEKELYLAGVRLNEKKPQVFIEKRLKGGIEISGNPGAISKETTRSLAREFGFLNGKVTFSQKVNQDQLIDVFLQNRVYVPGLKILSKIDLITKEELKDVLSSQESLVVPLSVKRKRGIEKLKEKIFSKLNLIRIYLRKNQKTPPDKEPLICKKGITVLGAAKKVSGELAKEIRGAKITGPSAKYPNQLVGAEHKLQDKDTVLFVKKR